MSINLDRNRVKQHLQNLDLQTLFIEELGWDRGGTNIEATVADNTYALEAIAHKRGMVAYQYTPASDDTLTSTSALATPSSASPRLKKCKRY